MIAHYIFLLKQSRIVEVIPVVMAVGLKAGYDSLRNTFSSSNYIKYKHRADDFVILPDLGLKPVEVVRHYTVLGMLINIRKAHSSITERHLSALFHYFYLRKRKLVADKMVIEDGSVKKIVAEILTITQLKNMHEVLKKYS